MQPTNYVFKIGTNRNSQITSLYKYQDGSIRNFALR